MITANTTTIGDTAVKLDALPDVADFRDRMFEATLVEVPPRIDLERFKMFEVPVSHQGFEGSCTGFGLSTVAHYLLRKRIMEPDGTAVSPRMFYEMAKRYDEWEGEDYEGSSARGAMKGWHKHGVCSTDLWTYEDGRADRDLNNERSSDALKRPLGAYYRVNHKDLVSMHTAIAEVGVLFATAETHEGWVSPDVNGIITPFSEREGGHAFAIVGYNTYGFWIQNSWGSDWGIEGCALLTYDDWLRNAMDVWVARLGVPINVRTASGTATALSDVVMNVQPQPLENVRPFIISIGNDGRLRSTGTYATAESDIERIFIEEIPGRSYAWQRKRLMLFAHGGLVSERQHLESLLKLGTMLVDEEVYLLAFHWHSGFLQTMEGILKDALQRRSPDIATFDHTRAFMYDRVDAALEPMVRSLSGKFLWDELKTRGVLATKNAEAGGRIFLRHLLRFMEANPEYEIHVVAHSAGSVFLAPLVQLISGSPDEKLPDGPMKGRTGHGLVVDSCSLWAPVNTMTDFRTSYLPAIEKESIRRFTLFTLTDDVEQNDEVGGIYHKSLPYLISHALEAHPSIPLISPDGESLLGISRDILSGRGLDKDFFDRKRKRWIVAPNGKPSGVPGASAARSHLAFETDRATIDSTLARMDDAD